MAQTIDVAFVFETEAANQGLTVVAGADVDDVCYGCVITSQQTLLEWLQKHAGPYNYQIVDRMDAGSPVIWLRRAVVGTLVLDLEIRASQCIKRSADQPAITYTRTDPMSLPREVQIQYISFDRQFETCIQSARHPAARRQKGILSAPIDFVLGDDQARSLAFDLLYRIWARQSHLTFEYPDPRIEPGDIINVIDDTTLANHVVLVDTVSINSGSGSAQINATGLLTSRGNVTVSAGTNDPFVLPNVAADTTLPVVGV